jgi:hypothetical protein
METGVAGNVHNPIPFYATKDGSLMLQGFRFTDYEQLNSGVDANLT